MWSQTILRAGTIAAVAAVVIVLSSPCGVLGQGVPELQADSDGASRLHIDLLPPEASCWNVVMDLIYGPQDGGTASEENTQPGDIDLQMLASCTAAGQTDLSRCCSVFMEFGLGSSQAGCLCHETFLSAVDSMVSENSGALLGVDVDFFLSAERCVQAGYPVPVAGNDLCPSSGMSDALCSSPTSKPASVLEADALLQLVQHNSSALPSWDRSTHVCCWDGVSCNEDERIIRLELRDEVGLAGPLPEAFSQLAHLQSLALLKGDLTGTIPASWSKLVNLESLSIPNQRISGTLPPELSVMRSLANLILPQNSLTGKLPESYSVYQTGALYLDLNRNFLTGTLPQSWSAMANVRRMLLDDNDLSGSLPSQWSALTNLTYLGMARNKQLQGTLPQEWSTLTSSIYLLIADAHLEGPLPATWSTMARLQVLWLGEHSLTGTVPREWSTFSKLHHLSLKSNLLTGSLPPEFSALQLNTFFLSNNWLTGSLPDCWAADAGPDYLGEGFLDFRLNLFSGMPEGYEEADNMYNCLPGVAGQRMCLPSLQPVAMMLVLAVCMGATLVLKAALSGWLAPGSDFRFSIQRAMKRQMRLHITKSTLLLFAALCAVSQRLFILSPAFSMIEPIYHRSLKLYLHAIGGEVISLLGGTFANALSMVPIFLLVPTFVVRGILALVPRPEWLPASVAKQAWTLVASEDVLRDNLQALKIDQLLLLAMFLITSVLVPLVVSLGLPDVIISREVDASVAWGASMNQLVYLPRAMMALLTGSFILSMYSMLAAVLLPGAVTWSSVAVNEAVGARSPTSQAQQSLRQLRRLRWAFYQALLSLTLFGLSIGVFVVTDWQEVDVNGVSSITWGTLSEAAAISTLVALQCLCVAGWNLSVWGRTEWFQLPAALSLRSVDLNSDEEVTVFHEFACSSSTDGEDFDPVTPDSPADIFKATAKDATVSRRSLVPQVNLVGRTRARNNALLLVIVLQMIHVGTAGAGLAVAWVTWLISVAILCWAVLVRDAPMGFDDIHDSAAFGMVVLAKDLAAALEADLRRGDDAGLGRDSRPVEAFQSFEDNACCADHPAGCPSCQLLLRRFPATLFRMQETLSVSYRWQRQVRAVVRPEGHGPLASSSGVRNQVVGINMTRWQRSELLAAILRSSYTYVWLDVLSIPAALRPMEGSRLWELSEKLMARMMAVYSAAASTLVLLSNEEEGGRYCQRAWTMQEYCGSRALDVVCQSSSNREAALVPEASIKRVRNMLSGFSTRRGRLVAFRDEEVERYKNLREYVRQSMTKAVPLWIRALCGKDIEIDDAEHRADLIASVMNSVTCVQPVDLVRALVPVLLNTSVQNTTELGVLVRAASLKCSADSEGAEAMTTSRKLLGLEEMPVDGQCSPRHDLEG